jgi:pimeloyl-ACP methyl ester carboxylesterase
MERTVEVGGGRVYVETVGEGPPTIVVPVPWGASHELYRSLLGELEIPLQLTYFDPEGTGASTPLPPTWNPGRIVDEIDAVRETVLSDQGVLLLGHAGGAFLAIAYAMDAPEHVDGLILISPYAGYERANAMSVARVESHDNWKSFQNRVAEIRRAALTQTDRFRAIFKEQRVIDMYDYKPHYFAMADAADETDFNPYMHEDSETDLLDELHRIEVPVLIVTGEDDPLSPLEEVRLLADRLPYVRLLEFPRCGHYPFVEYPEAFTTAVEEFVAQIKA